MKYFLRHALRLSDLIGIDARLTALFIGLLTISCKRMYRAALWAVLGQVSCPFWPEKFLR
jgi:predicted branched-subunit amino acid permease